MAESPYLPVTKRFANPIYLRIEDVPEYAYLGQEDRAAIQALAEPLRAMNTSATCLSEIPSGPRRWPLWRSCSVLH